MEPRSCRVARPLADPLHGGAPMRRAIALMLISAGCSAGSESSSTGGGKGDGWDNGDGLSLSLARARDVGEAQPLDLTPLATLASVQSFQKSWFGDSVRVWRDSTDASDAFGFAFGQQLRAEVDFTHQWIVYASHDEYVRPEIERLTFEQGILVIHELLHYTGASCSNRGAVGDFQITAMKFPVPPIAPRDIEIRITEQLDACAPSDTRVPATPPDPVTAGATVAVAAPAWAYAPTRAAIDQGDLPSGGSVVGTATSPIAYTLTAEAGDVVRVMGSAAADQDGENIAALEAYLYGPLDAGEWRSPLPETVLGLGVGYEKPSTMVEARVTSAGQYLLVIGGSVADGTSYQYNAHVTRLSANGTPYEHAFHPGLYVAGGPTIAPNEHALTRGVVADITGDGRKDAVFVGSDGSLLALVQGPDGVLTRTDVSAPALWSNDEAFPTLIGVRDLDGDGADDLVITRFGFDPHLVVLHASPGKLEQQLAVPETLLAIGNLGGDAPALVSCANKHLQIRHGDLTEITAVVDDTGAPVACGNDPYDQPYPLVADIDGDGHDDLIRLVGSSVIIHAGGSASPTRRIDLGIPPVTMSTGYMPFWLQLADLTGDGLLDLVVATTDYTRSTTQVWLFPGQGGGTYAVPAQIDSARMPYHDIGPFVDLDGDGKADMWSGSWGVFARSVHDASGMLGELASYAPARAGAQLSRLYDVGALDANVGDLNGDGCPDIVAGNETTGGTIFYGDGCR